MKKSAYQKSLLGSAILTLNSFNYVKRSFSYFFAILALVLISGCGSGDVDTASKVIQNKKSEVAPDKRVAIFNVEATSGNGRITLTGETDQPEGLSALVDSLLSVGLSVENKVNVLPDAELGDRIYALPRNSVINIRSNPRHSAELATQALLGMPLKVLKKDGGWYLVQTPENYISWVDGGGIQLTDEAGLQEWKNADKIIFLENFGFSFEGKSKESQKVTDLVMGDVLKLNADAGPYFEVEYPDGRIAYVLKSEAMKFNNWVKNTSANEESLVATSKKLIGIPYLWGGTSSKGADCSGFTKTVYLMNGKIIPRDASQQVFAGEFVDDTKNFKNLRPGDLLFFGTPATAERGRRVVHVGMWIGNNEFIHSSGQVRVSSIDHEAPNYDEFNVNRYLESRRYIEKYEGNIIEMGDMFN